MKINEAKDIISKVLPKNRKEHSFRVAEVALRLAKQYKLNEEEVELAALLHDYAKDHGDEELKQWILNSSLPKNLLFYSSQIWHGPVGALILKQKYGIKNNNVLSAIYSHTTAKENMSPTDQIIFISDYIEPKRNIPGVDRVREIANEDLNLATYQILKNMIEYLMSEGNTIYPSTFYAYNNYAKLIRNKDGGHGFL